MLSGSASSERDAWAGLRADLESTVRTLALEIGIRNVADGAALERARDFVAGELQWRLGAVRQETYEAEGQGLANLVAEVPGQSGEIVLLGAHYDSAPGSPGANDNATGVAVLLAVARALAGTRPLRTVRLVAFTAEEDPHYQTDLMGSVVHARGCRERGEQVTAMVSLDEVGYFTREPRSQGYPFPLNLIYPSVGDFLAVVGNFRSRRLVRAVAAPLRSSGITVRDAAVPGFLAGVGASDHWSFWQSGYPAVLVTDTANFRYRPFHTPDDLPDQLDTGELSRVAVGVASAIAELAGLP
jgi:hypothetical protein